MMNSLLKKFYNIYAIIYVQNSPKLSYIKYYNIIHALHWQLTSYDQSYHLINHIAFMPSW